MGKAESFYFTSIHAGSSMHEQTQNSFDISSRYQCETTFRERKKNVLPSRLIVTSSLCVRSSSWLANILPRRSKDSVFFTGDLGLVCNTCRPVLCLLK